MSIRIVRLGSDRAGNEGIRIGTVRRPPRGIPKAEFSSGNWYDVWLPNLSPSPETMKMGRSATTEKEWLAFKKKYLAEMAQADKIRVIEMLAVMSHNSNFSVGCYCENEARCHRSILRDLLLQYGAEIEE
ncbi:DUF488 domain-containing protein [Desulfosediminicola sp.]|uniref:DUF488 domain-containing protein n=1 Tax=Desulfosediminicola sp. TaxID=2886825 RepID=UPI003AF28297